MAVFTSYTEKNSSEMRGGRWAGFGIDWLSQN